MIGWLIHKTAILLLHVDFYVNAKTRNKGRENNKNRQW